MTILHAGCHFSTDYEKRLLAAAGNKQFRMKLGANDSELTCATFFWKENYVQAKLSLAFSLVFSTIPAFHEFSKVLPEQASWTHSRSCWFHHESWYSMIRFTDWSPIIVLSMVSFSLFLSFCLLSNACFLVFYFVHVYPLLSCFMALCISVTKIAGYRRW